MIWLDKWVKVEKVYTPLDPLRPTPSREEYEANKKVKKMSIPLNYWILGQMFCEPKIGDSLFVLRHESNGEPKQGTLQTSIITGIEEIPEEDGSIFLSIRTLNSIYWVEESAKAEEKYGNVPEDNT